MSETAGGVGDGSGCGVMVSQYVVEHLNHVLALVG
jgi:hypothetical protein